MAKRKNATALFEVIHAGNRFPGTQSSPWFRAPSWWRWPRQSNEAMHAAPAIMARAESAAAEKSAVSAKVVNGAGESGSRVSAAFHVSLDQDCHTVSIRMSYVGAAVVATTVLAAVGMAFVIGRHGSRGAMPALAEQTTEQLRQMPARADVMDISTEESAVAPTVKSSAAAATNSAKPLSSGEPRPTPTLMVDDQVRQVGLNYVIVQNYLEDKKLAQDVCDLLIKRGILCTVEPGPKGWAAMNTFSVVGLRGFDKTKTQECEDYIAEIVKVGKEFAPGTKFKQFAPKPFKWKQAK